jgi:hypothetical protein
MKNNVLFFGAILFLLLVAFSSCGKHDHKDNEAPTVTMTSPAEGAVFNTADSILFLAFATDDEDLHSGRISIVRTSDDYLLAAKSLYAHAMKSYDVNDKLLVTVSQTTAAKAIVQFEDHDGKVTTKEANITINP